MSYAHRFMAVYPDAIHLYWTLETVKSKAFLHADNPY